MSQSHLMTVNRLNDYGASCIMSADYRNAVRSLAQGLQDSRRLQDTLDESQQNSGHCCLDSVMIQPYHRLSSKQSDCDPEPMLYHRPIQIPEHELTSSYSSCVLLSVALIFNLALAHHMLALSGNEENAAGLLRKAARFYEYGFDLQQGHNENGKNAELFYIATFHNLGKVYQALGNQENAKKCCHQLMSTISESDRQQDLEESIYDVFHRHAFQMTFQGILTDAAAAAA